AWMDALDLRSVIEILAHAACKAARESQRVIGLRPIELEQVGDSRRCAENAGERRVVIPSPRRHGMHRRSEPGHHVVPRHGGNDDVTWACAVLLGARQPRWK